MAKNSQNKRNTKPKTTGKRRRKKRRTSRASLIIVFNGLLIIILFCLYQIIPYVWTNYESNSQYQSLAEDYVDASAAADADTDEDTADTGESADAAEWWGDVVIDFDSLQAINSDIVAWIRFDDTDAVPIDYPILYDGTNDSYIHTTIYGEYSYEGCLFIEAANSGDLTDLNTIIYGHAMRNNHMFGSLKYYRQNQNFVQENGCFTIYMPGVAYRYQIFSYFTTEYDSDVYQIGFSAGSSAYQEYLDYLLENSQTDCGYVPESTDPIVILSTCATGYGTDSQRFVVFGARIGIAATD